MDPEDIIPQPLPNTTRLSRWNCVNCGKELDSASHPTQRVSPSPGDVTICVYCGNAQVFKADMSGLRPMTIPETIEMSNNPEFKRALTISAMYRARFGEVKRK